MAGRYEYKVVELREGLMGGKMSGSKMEKVLNDHAGEGWQLKAITSVEADGSVASRSSTSLATRARWFTSTAVLPEARQEVTSLATRGASVCADANTGRTATAKAAPANVKPMDACERKRANAEETNAFMDVPI